MQERPIIFSGESVQAILEGRKTQTRRVAKLYPSAEGKRFAVFPPEEIIKFDDGTFTDPRINFDSVARRLRRGTATSLSSASLRTVAAPSNIFHLLSNYRSTGALSGPYSCSYGVPGDQLWVKEPFWYSWCQESTLRYARLGENLFIANFKDKTTSDSSFFLPSDTSEKWRSPWFMPRKVSRLTLKIVDVRVERVDYISDADVKAEGFKNYTAFANAFDDLNRKRGFSIGDSPWVWVIEFKKV